MIKFQSFLSGSSGNSTFVTDGESKILVDCGANGKYIEECLERIDVEANDINAILISHAHRDHVFGVGVLSRRFDIPIYASEDTWDEMLSIIGNIKEKNIKIIKSDEQLNQILVQEMKNMGITMPWEKTHGSFDGFMQDNSAVLRFS